MESLDQSNWEEFLASPLSVLVLSKTDCQSCSEWFSELENYDVPEKIRLGKLLLDAPGIARFKIAQPWISQVDILPFNVVFVDGERKTQWGGGGIKRLQNRLGRFL